MTYACPPEAKKLLPLDAALCVGFGYVEVTRDGERIWQGDDWEMKLRAFERKALDHPGQWKVTFEGPLQGATYVREGEGRWVLTETSRGFA